MSRTIVTILLLSLIFLAPSPVLGDVTSGIDMGEYVRNSGLIFKGRVTKVEYKNSEPVPLLDSTGTQVYENGNPVYVDGSNLPHTFVTFDVEQIYKGSLATRVPEVVLRFEGGQSDVPDSNEVGPAGEPVYNDFFLVSGVPLFDVNDRDFLFVKGNTPTPCFLYRWARGRFRILDDPNVPASINVIYNEYGQQVRLTSELGGDPNGIVMGDVQNIPDVLTHTMGSMELSNVFVNDGVEEVDPDIPILPGVHATESEFGAFITRVVLEECGTGVPPKDCGVELVSHDPNAPFYGIELRAVEPNDLPETEMVYTRPWLDGIDPSELAEILEQERIEAELFTGNPVLPETPCELQIFYEGRLIGDVSGPQGKPDCYVDLFDIAAMAGIWLECNHPEDVSCFN
ncbi:MAG: hypothetical protein FVQ82_05070 [Planctomycetes bacterium]|nr:hypothetical protein [Planctomycetota bacterium]